MYDTYKDLVDAYRAGPAILKVLLEDYTPETARQGAEGEWSVVEIVCHLRDAEERALERMRLMRDQDHPFLPGYNQEDWARERNYAQADLAEALAAFGRFRAQHAVDLAALSPEQWERTGQHEEMGTISILNHTIHMVSHDFVHGEQLARRREVHA